MVHNQYNSALLVIVFPCRQVSDSAAGSQVYLVSMNNVEEEPDITISFVAPAFLLQLLVRLAQLRKASILKSRTRKHAFWN